MADPADLNLGATLLMAAGLGALEGLTEFLPVSSTGHLILAVDLLDLVLPPERVFEIAIQSGAILAVCVTNFAQLRTVSIGARRDPAARAFLRNVLLTSAPAAALGLAFHETILAVLFDPRVVAWALVVGGIAMLLAERVRRPVRFRDISQISPKAALAIGCAQCLALVPGMSCSAASIIGALLVGVERSTAARYSFFVALPVLLGAAGLQLIKTADKLVPADVLILTVGALTAFVFAVLAIRLMLSIVSNYGFGPFAIYRIVIGIALIVFLW